MRELKHVPLVLVLGLFILAGAACTRTPEQTRFATPEAASAALLEALKTNDTGKLGEIFGRDVVETIASGDPVSDRRDREVVALAMEQSCRWSPLGEGRSELIIGDEQWPYPAPLVKIGSEWQFDSETAKEEILARRIGRNELHVISLCRAYADAQREYASQSHDGKPAGLFARRIRSSPDRQDGLYYPTKPGQRRSPLGDLAAQAALDGYSENKSSSSPFWGYQFRILSAQGDAAPGGRKSYLNNEDMSGGFALVAFPARYAYSGVMTFIVNQDGAVYEKDLGQDTATLAAGMAEYNPDQTWTIVRSEGAEIPGGN
jgi:hypothetical protein